MFAESLEDIKIAEELHNCEIIAMNQYVQTILNKKGLQYSNTLDLFGQCGHEFVSNKAEPIIEVLRSCRALRECIGGEYGYSENFMHFIRHYVYYCLAVLYIVKSALSDYEDGDVVIVRDVNDLLSFYKTIGTVGDNISMLPCLIKSYADSHQIKTKILFDESVGDKRKKWYRIRSVIGRGLFEIQLLIFRIFFRGKDKIFLYSDVYNMDRIVSRLGVKNNLFKVYLRSSFNIKGVLKGMVSWRAFGFSFVPDQYFSASCRIDEIEKALEQHYFELCRGIVDNEEKFLVYGVSLEPYVKKYVDEWLHSYIRKIYIKSFHLSRVMDGANIKLSISQTAVGLAYSLSDISRKMNISSLLVPHGSFPPQKQSNAFVEWREHGRTLMNTHYEYVAVQSKWAAEYFQQQDEVFSRRIVTGPLIFSDKMRQSYDRVKMRSQVLGVTSSDIVVLHASTPKLFGNFIPYIYETFDEYVNNINQAILAVEKMAGVRLVIRFRVKGVRLEDFKNRLVKSKRYSIVTSGSFEDLLWMSDALISYSSTAIEEALINRIPVLQYDPDNKYSHIDAINAEYSDKKSGVYYAVSSGSLFVNLERLFDDHIISKKFTDGDWRKYRINVDSNWSSDLMDTHAG